MGALRSRTYTMRVGEMDHAEEKMAGIQRLVQVRAQIDERASLILTFHAALEREMDLKLSRILPRAHKLRGLGFGQKVAV